jgi:hypothetical protein
MELWSRGWWTGLLTATTFAVILNAGLLASFRWSAYIPTMVMVAGWVLLAIGWICGICFSIRRCTGGPSPHEPSARSQRFERVFEEAQTEYLRGHWYEAERALDELLDHCPHDVEARLLLATLYRHTSRADEALQQLRALSRLEGAGQWELEIRMERDMLNRKQSDENVSI